MPMIVYRPASLVEILPLRERIIIRGTNRPPEFPGDADSTTIHFGAFLNDETVCCATFMLSEWRGDVAYQLRGMATEPAHQGRGIGASLLCDAEQYILETTAVRCLWCNARLAAAEFYAKQGWQADGVEFHVQHVGPHRKMFKPLLP